MKPFGARLKEARVGRKLSRLQVERMSGGAISEEAIKCLEYSTTREPRPATLIVLIKIFPQLGTSTKDIAVIGHLYQNASTVRMLSNR